MKIFLQITILLFSVSLLAKGRGHTHKHHKYHSKWKCGVNIPNECISGERIINGDFEEDIINRNWDLLPEMTGWDFKWTRSRTCESRNKRDAYIEIQRFQGQQLPGSEQYVELDTDCDNGSKKRTTNVKLFQEIDAYPGERLHFSFNYKARRIDRKNRLKVRFGSRHFNFRHKHFKDTEWKKFEKIILVKRGDIKRGKLKVSFTDKGKADTYGIFIDNVSVKSLDCNITDPCTKATEVISYSPEGDIPSDRIDPSKALGEPNGEPYNPENTQFVSLGFGGEIVLKLDNPVKNKEGMDLRVWEVTGGNNTYEQYKEEAEVYGSLDSINWTYLGIVKNDNGDETLGQIDLGAMEEALYIKIKDVSPVVRGRDGYDVDAVTCINQ